MRLPSASNLSRCLACPASYALPQTPDEASESALRGTEIHAYLEQHVNRDHDPSAAQGELELSDDTAEYVQRLDPTEALQGREVVAAEVTFTYTPRTDKAAQLAKEVKVDYRNSEEFIGGTADLVLKEPDGRWVILDWKSGTNVEHPAENKQLLFFATCLRAIYGKDTPVSGEIAFLDPITGKITLVRANYSVEATDAFKKALWAALEEMKRAEGTLSRGQALTKGLKTGPHCKYCPAFSLCPQQRHLAQSIAAGAVLGIVPQKGSIMVMSPKAAGVAWQRLKELRQLLAQVEWELRCYAEDTPIELPNGGTISVKQTQRESLSAEIARKVLTEQGGKELAEAASSYSVSKASIKRGLKALGKPNGAKDMNLLLEQLAARGGIVKTMGTRLVTTLPGGVDDNEDEIKPW